MFIFDAAPPLAAGFNDHWTLANYLLLCQLLMTAYLGWRKPVVAVAAAASSLTAYLLRSSISGIPVTFLELTILAALSGWTVRWLSGNALVRPRLPRSWLLPLGLLLASATVSAAIAPDPWVAWGQWKAYIVEPILLGVMLHSTVRTRRGRALLLYSVGVAGLGVAILAITQWFTGIGIARPEWVAPATRRVTAMFTSPNAVGLMLGPIAALFAGWLAQRPGTLHPGQLPWHVAVKVGFLVTLLSAIAATRSAGALLGVTAAAAVLVAATLRRRSVLPLAVGFAVALLIGLGPLRGQFTDHSATNRSALWAGSISYLQQSPEHALLGNGLGGFPATLEGFRDPRRLERVLYPHTLLLNFWLELGLAGLVAMLWLIVIAIQRAVQVRDLAALAAIATFVGHGLVDVPFFKNDLAVLWWVVLALPWLGYDVAGADGKPAAPVRWARLPGPSGEAGSMK